MEGVSLTALSKPLISIGKAVAPIIKRLHAEHQAGADNASIRTNLLDASLEETLGRLQDIEAHDAWWRDLLQRAASQYVRPEYLEKPAIREWLSEPAVRADLKALARAQLVPGSNEDAAVAARVAERYAVRTGEAAALATGPIEAILNILLAGSLAPASKGDLLTAGMVQEAQRQTIPHLERIETKLDARAADAIVIEAHTEKAKAALGDILRRRALPLVDVRAELLALSHRLGNEGDLRFCAASARAEIFLWVARLHAQTPDTLELARRFRGSTLSVLPTADTAILDAWLSATSGDAEGGLVRLRDIDTPDARSNVFFMLARHQGARRP